MIMTPTTICIIIVVLFIGVAIIKKTAKYAFIGACIYLVYIFLKSKGYI